MSEKYLFEIFLEERIEDISKAILLGGINSILTEFEGWLYSNYLISGLDEERFRENLTK